MGKSDHQTPKYLFCSVRVFNTNFGGGPGFRRQYQQQRPQQPAHPLSQLLQFLPVLLLLLWTFMQIPSAPVSPLFTQTLFRAPWIEHKAESGAIWNTLVKAALSLIGLP